MRSLHRSLLILALAAGLPACGGGGGGGGPAPVPVVLVSAASDGTPGNAASDTPSISSTGQFVAFQSTATNLTLPATTLGNVYRKDMTTAGIVRVSRRSNANGNVQPNAASRSPAISPDGNLIAYVSAATDIVDGFVANGGFTNIYLYDVLANTTTLISHSTAGLLQEANGNSDNPAIAINGADVYVTYESAATDLLAGITYTASTINVFRSLAGGATALVSLDDTTPTTAGNNHSSRPSISTDGGFIAFQSMATNLVAGDSNGLIDVFVRNMANNDITRVSVTDAGTQLGGAGSATQGYISGDGLDVVFLITGTDIPPGGVDVDIYMRSNWNSGGAATALISLHPTTGGTGNSCQFPVLSQDGNLVVWNSGSNFLVNSDTNGLRDVFQFNISANAFERVLLTAGGAEATGGSGTAVFTRPAITPTGTFIAFDADHTNIISPATTVRHVYRRG